MHTWLVLIYWSSEFCISSKPRVHLHSVKILLSRVIVLSFLLFNFKTMVTWWYWTTSFTLVFHVSCFIFLLIHIWILSSSQQSSIHHAGLHYLLSFYSLFLLSILLNPLLTSPGSCTQDLLIPVYPIHDFS